MTGSTPICKASSIPSSPELRVPVLTHHANVAQGRGALDGPGAPQTLGLPTPSLTRGQPSAGRDNRNGSHLGMLLLSRLRLAAAQEGSVHTGAAEERPAWPSRQQAGGFRGGWGRRPVSLLLEVLSHPSPALHLCAGPPRSWCPLSQDKGSS